MWSKILFLIGLLHPLVQLASAQGLSCVTPNSKPGNCINIRRCEPLLNLLQTEGSRAGDFLRRSVCGFEGLDPIVCCPQSSRNIENDVDENRHNKEIQNTPYGPLEPPVCGFSNISHSRIVGGVPAKLGAWPWITALGYTNTKSPNDPKFLCGGSLISVRHVLTAAHCVYRRNDLYMARIGDLDLINNNDGAHPVNVNIEKKTVHPLYNPTQVTNDIAVLRLAHDVPISEHIYPICLPAMEPMKSKNLDRLYPFVAGWGSTAYKGQGSNMLLEIQLPVVNTETCRNDYKEFKQSVIDQRVVCAGFQQGGKDACQGDSGGPLMLPQKDYFYVIGVVSYGYQCATAGYPGIYTRVTAFLDFITANMN